MKVALVWALLPALVLLVSSSVYAQSDDAPGDQTSEVPGTSDGQQPATATPQVVIVVVTATPEATATPNPTPVVVMTRNGPKTQDQLQLELQTAGYTGPWDTDSMLAAFNRAYVAPTPTPLPTANPTQAQCRAAVAAMPGFQQVVQDAAKASARNDYQALRSIAAQVRGSTYPGVIFQQ